MVSEGLEEVAGEAESPSKGKPASESRPRSEEDEETNGKNTAYREAYGGFSTHGGFAPDEDMATGSGEKSDEGPGEAEKDDDPLDSKIGLDSREKQSPGDTGEVDVFANSESFDIMKYSHLKKLSFPKYEAFVSDLETDRVLFVSSFDDQICLAATCLLLRKLKSSPTGRMFDVKKNDPHLEYPVEIGSFLKAAPEVGASNGDLFYINTHRVVANSVIDSLIYEIESSEEQLRKRLKRLNRMIVVAVEPDRFMQEYYDSIRFVRNSSKSKQASEISPEGARGRIKCWEIGYITPLLNIHFEVVPEEGDGENKIYNIQNEIYNLFENRGWSEWNRSVYDRFSQAFSKARLREEIDKWKVEEQEDEGAFIENILNTAKSKNEKIEGYEILALAVLFAGAFFQDLTPNDFSRLVETLLDRRQIEVREKLLRTQSDGRPIGFENKIEVALSSIWKRRREDLLVDCKIKSFQSRNRPRVMDFSRPVRDVVRKYMEENYALFVEDMYKSCRKMLFDLSDKVCENVKLLAVRKIAEDQDFHGVGWLVELVGDIRYFREEKLIADWLESSDQSDSLPPQLKPLAEYFSKVTEARSFLISRIVSLLRDLQDGNAFFVKRFLDKLMDIGQHEVLLDIAKRLGTAPGFDKAYWLKQLLERGKPPVVRLALGELSRHIENSKSRFYERLKNLTRWLPEHDQKYSDSSKFAAVTVAGFLLNETFRFDTHGHDRDEDALVFFSFSDSDGFEADASILAFWLTHPATQNALEEERYFPTETLAHLCYSMVIGGIDEYENTDVNQTLAAHFEQRASGLARNVRERRGTKYIMAVSFLLTKWHIFGSEYEPKEMAEKFVEAVLSGILKIVGERQSGKLVKKLFFYFWEYALSDIKWSLKKGEPGKTRGALRARARTLGRLKEILVAHHP